MISRQRLSRSVCIGVAGALALVAVPVATAIHTSSTAAGATCPTAVVIAGFEPGHADWARLNQWVTRWSFATTLVLNPLDGPGRNPDSQIASVARAAQARGSLVYGYVLPWWSFRSVSGVVADVQRYIDWYGVDGIFLDQVTGDPFELEYYRAISAAIRSRGKRVVFEVGHPRFDPRYMALTDVMVSFEGTPDEYAQLEAPEGLAGFGADRFWHLVHTADAGAVTRVVALASNRTTSKMAITDGRLPYPFAAMASYAEALPAVLCSGPGPEVPGATGTRGTDPGPEVGL